MLLSEQDTAVWPGTDISTKLTPHQNRSEFHCRRFPHLETDISQYSSSYSYHLSSLVTCFACLITCTSVCVCCCVTGFHGEWDKPWLLESQLARLPVSELIREGVKREKGLQLLPWPVRMICAWRGNVLLECRGIPTGLVDVWIEYIATSRAAVAISDLNHIWITEKKAKKSRWKPNKLWAVKHFANYYERQSAMESQECQN